MTLHIYFGIQHCKRKFSDDTRVEKELVISYKRIFIQVDSPCRFSSIRFGLFQNEGRDYAGEMRKDQLVRRMEECPRLLDSLCSERKHKIILPESFAEEFWDLPHLLWISCCLLGGEQHAHILKQYATYPFMYKMSSKTSDMSCHLLLYTFHLWLNTCSLNN